MLTPKHRSLEDTTHEFLKAQQLKIDALSGNFSAMKEKAEELWRNKRDGSGETAFQDILVKLKEMAVATAYCNYCEHNLILPSTIEHIRPKSTFPSHAFRWENFTAVCENCNMGYKKAQMKVFCPAGSDVVSNVGYSEPCSDDLAFIDLRSENPMEIVELDFEDFQFYPRKEFMGDARIIAKVENTTSILHLNEKDISRSRRDACRHFMNRLRDYRDAMLSTNNTELSKAVHGIPRIDFTCPFLEEQARIAEHIKDAITNETHQTVWREMVSRPEEISDHFADLLKSVPQAHTW